MHISAWLANLLALSFSTLFHSNLPTDLSYSFVTPALTRTCILDNSEARGLSQPREAKTFTITSSANDTRMLAGQIAGKGDEHHSPLLRPSLAHLSLIIDLRLPLQCPCSDLFYLKFSLQLHSRLCLVHLCVLNYHLGYLQGIRTTESPFFSIQMGCIDDWNNDFF